MDGQDISGSIDLLIDAARDAGLEGLADDLETAVTGGATGTEILGRVHQVLRAHRRELRGHPDLRRQARDIARAINKRLLRWR